MLCNVLCKNSRTCIPKLTKYTFLQQFCKKNCAFMKKMLFNLHVNFPLQSCVVLLEWNLNRIKTICIDNWLMKLSSTSWKSKIEMCVHPLINQYGWDHCRTYLCSMVMSYIYKNKSFNLFYLFSDTLFLP